MGDSGGQIKALNKKHKRRKAVAVVQPVVLKWDKSLPQRKRVAEFTNDMQMMTMI